MFHIFIPFMINFTESQSDWLPTSAELADRYSALKFPIRSLSVPCSIPAQSLFDFCLIQAYRRNFKIS